MDRNVAIEIAGRMVGAVIRLMSSLSYREPWRKHRTRARRHGGCKGRRRRRRQAANYTAETITIDHDGADFRIDGGLWDGRRLYELYEEAHTPWEMARRAFRKAANLASPFFPRHSTKQPLRSWKNTIRPPTRSPRLND